MSRPSEITYMRMGHRADMARRRNMAHRTSRTRQGIEFRSSSAFAQITSFSRVVDWEGVASYRVRTPCRESSVKYTQSATPSSRLTARFPLMSD